MWLFFIKHGVHYIHPGIPVLAATNRPGDYGLPSFRLTLPFIQYI